jgi:flagellin
MTTTINTNTSSLNAQRNLMASAGSLATSMQRLSSGLRVNSAKDDAAGLAISERFSSQIKGLTVGARNSNDGISLAQTAEGTLGKVGDMLQRMRELAVQASNSTNSKDDRQALQSEVSQLTDEVDRMAKQTSFNGKKVLDGSFAGAVFQVGANAGDNITVGTLTNASAKGLANVAYGQKTVTTTVDALATSSTSIASQAAGVLTIKVGGATAPAIDLGGLAMANSGMERLGQVVEAVNRKSSDTGVTAFLSKNDTGTYQVDLKSDRLDSSGAAETVVFAGFTAASTGVDSTDVPTAVAAGTDATGIDTLSIKTQADAWVAIKKIDSAINQVNSTRANLGALQSRFESAVSNTAISVENMSAAKGRIVDADFAQETASLTRNQILQQAGTAMLSQANKLPQSVLSLLQ